MISLTGHSALITGGTQGVGLAIAEALARAGSRVVLHTLRIDEMALAAAERCGAAGMPAPLIAGDLSGETQPAVDHLVAEALRADQGIDLLVNNAGTYLDIDFLEMDVRRFEYTFRLNVAAGYFLTQAFARRWISNNTSGRVLFTGSINGLLSEPTHTAYDASKGAVAALVRSLCVSLAPRRIRVNALAPGLVVTPLTKPILDDPAIMNWMRLHTPNGQVPAASVCGPAAVFLLSDAAEHIHGQTLLVDGGMSCWQQPDLPEALRAQMAR